MKVDDLDKYFRTKMNELSKQIRADAYQLSTNIINKTPVDEGRARSNWFLAFGNPYRGAAISTDKSGDTAASRANQQLTKFQLGDVIYFTNNLPYIKTLEYGKFPKPVKRGSRNSRTKQYEIKSNNGYSKQAPQGMVRISIQEFKNAGILS